MELLIVKLADEDQSHTLEIGSDVRQGDHGAIRNAK
jgi:hypothetical protein